MLVGEMPGDQEDRAGEPFVGPAGSVLQQALQAANLEPNQIYLTNTVKHFKWRLRGKRRLHSKPGRREVVSCRAWLEAEIQVLRPTIIVCLGATAAQALLGNQFRIICQRGQLLASKWAPWIVATFHPSAILRAPGHEERARMMEMLIQDLRLVATRIMAAASDQSSC